MQAAMRWILVWPPSLIAFALGAPVVLMCAVTVLGGVAIGLFGVWWETALAERIPPQMLSRVSAYDWMGSLAFLPLGYLLAGVVGDAVGSAETLAIGGAISVVALAIGGLPRSTRTLARLPASVHGTPPPVAALVPDRQ
jgi:hypothetical protein